MGKQNQKWDIIQIYRGIRLIGIILAVYVTMEYVLPVIFPFCIGFVIAAMLYPLRRWLERRVHLKREAAGIAAFFLGIGLLAGAAALICYLLFCGGNVLGRMNVMNTLQSNGNRMWDVCCGRLHDLTGRWIMRPGDYGKLLQQMRTHSFELNVEQLADNWKNVSGKTLKWIAYAVVAMVSSLLILHDYEKIRKKISHICGHLFYRNFGQTMRHVGRTYLKAQFMIMFVITSQCMVGLLLAGEHYWLALGLAIGVCDALPFLGTGIVLLPWAVWRLVCGRYVSGVWFILLYLITSFTRQTLEPKLIGHRIGVPPLAVLFCIYVGVQVYSRAGFLLGPVSGLLIWQLCGDEAEKEDGG